MSAAAVNAYDAWEAQPDGWPIKRADLAALKDLGLSDRQIAIYFRVRQDEVATLRISYGVPEVCVPAKVAPPKRRRFQWRRRA